MKVKYKEVLALIEKLRNVKYNHVDISNMLGGKPTANALATRAATGGYLNEEELNVITEYTGIDFRRYADMSENYIDIDYYPDVFGSCGGGNFVLSETKEKMTIPKKNFLKFSPLKNYSIINARGDSMAPFILNKDYLIIEHIENNQISDNEIYVFCYKDKIFTKRLISNVNELVIKSDNPDKDTYRTIYLKDEELNNVYIIGQVVGILRDLRK